MRRRIGAVLILFGLAAAIPTSPVAAAVPTELEYVALGDSYSAGFGIFPLVPPADQDPACFQAQQNYPHQVAAALGANLTDMTCSGAVTANITTDPQHPGIPTQGSALNGATDLVTITIGGNDMLFADVTESCLAEGPAGPLLLQAANNCRSLYHTDPPPVTIDLLIDRLDTLVVPRLNATYDYIRTQAPNAKVFVIGYPTVSPSAANVPAGGCYTSPMGTGGNEFLPPFPENAFPFTDIDTLYLHHIENEIDNAIETAAVAHGFTFVPTWDATATHSACSKTDPYIFGITLTNDSTKGQSTPLPTIFVVYGAVHPNPKGVKFFADTTIAAIRGHPEFAEAPPRLPASGASPLLLAGIAVVLLGCGLVAVRRRGSPLGLRR